MKKIAAIFCLLVTFQSYSYVHRLITYKPCPESMLSNPCPVSSYFTQECIIHFGKIDLSFDASLSDLFITYIFHDDNGATLFVDKRRRAIFIEYFSDDEVMFNELKSAMDDYISLTGSVEGIEDLEDILI